MKTRDLSQQPDGLDALVVDARADLDDVVARELRDIAPDFAAVVEAAHARDPQRISRAARDEAVALAPVVILASESARISVRGQSELGALLADARDEVDAELAALRRAGFPPVPVPKTSPPRRRWLWAAAAAAAAVLLAAASPMLATRFEAARGTPSEAPWWQRAVDSAREATEREATPAPARERSPSTATLAEPPAPAEPAIVEPADPAIVEPAIVEPADPAEPADAPVPKTRKPARPAVEAEALPARLRRLAGEAEAAWQSGDHAGAEARHREIIALAPGSRAADISYGDLFTLARQRSGPEQEQALWREYLAAFPRGRHADDARAGLCRRADPDAVTPCWQRYLADFPAGVHRSQAARVLDAPAP